jgi:small subunit ribosomal protein S12
MATTFLRNLVLRPALHQQPLALPRPAPIARAFSTTPSQSATLMQVLRVCDFPPGPYLK